MSDTIRDGKGNGYLTQVDSKNRLRAYAVTEDEPTWINRVEAEMYSATWDGSITAASADNYIVYLKNTSTTKDMVIVKIKHRCTGGNGTISVWLNVIGTPGGSLTTLTPTNRNSGSNNEAACTFYKSAEISGLSNGRKVGSVYGKEDEEFEYLQPCSGYILPPNGTLAIKANDSTAAHYGGLSLYFRDRT
jgi:hypothetical protein